MITVRRVLFLIGVAFCSADCDRYLGEEKTSPTGPTIVSVTPSELFRGQSGDATIAGTNFSGVTGVGLGDGVNVTQIVSVASTEIVVHFSVRSDAQPGPRTVNVTGPQGSVTSPSLLRVSSNHVPRAEFTINPPTGLLDVPVTFDASPSSDPGGRIASYQWDFGDGRSAHGRIVSHRFSSAATFTVKLTVSDHENATASATRQFQVKYSVPPEARFSVNPDHGDVSTLFRFDAGSSSDRDGHITEYKWAFGDGSTAGGRVAEHRFTREDRFRVTLSVVDNHGLTGERDRIVRVERSSADDDVATFTVSPDPGNVNDTFHFDAFGSSAGGGIVSYSWSFGDGGTGSGRTVDHKYATEGTYTVALQVISGDGHSATTSRSFRVYDADDGGGGDGTLCTTPSRKHEPFFFKVLSENRADGRIVGKFVDNVSCSDVFYRCGDVRIGGIQPGSKEYWIGIICEMRDLGNNTFEIRLVDGKYWVTAGESDTYVWPQEGDCTAACR